MGEVALVDFYPFNDSNDQGTLDYSPTRVYTPLVPAIQHHSVASTASTVYLPLVCQVASVLGPFV